MPLPLLFIGIAAATGSVGVGKTIKAGIDSSVANRINKNANQIVPTDKASRLMIERCQEFIKNPPSDWNGAIALTSK